MRTYRLEVTQGSGTSALWYFHLRAPNGRIVMDSAEGYSSRGHARRAALRLVIVFGSHAVALMPADA